MSQPRYLVFIVLKVAVTIGTFPYYRLFHFNTLQPIRLIAFYSSQPEHYNKLVYHLNRWWTRKLAELQFVSIAVSLPDSASDALDPGCLFLIDLHPFTVCYFGCCCDRFILLECYSRRLLAGLGTLVL